MGLYALTKEGQYFFLNGVEISGIQNVSMNYNIPSEALRILGITGVTTIPTGPRQGNVSVNGLVVSTERFIGYTGSSGFNGYILKDKNNPSDQNFSFSSGYVTSYNSRCSIGEVPQFSTNIIVFGDIGQFDQTVSNAVSGDLNTNIPNYVADLNLSVATPGDLTLSFNDAEKNRIISYNLSINVPRNPIYYIGDTTPSKVEINWPIEVNLQFEMDADVYNAKKVSSYPCNTKIEDISITLKDNLGNSIQSFSFNDMELISESYSANIDGNSKVNASYRTFLLGD